ncbi:MAG: MFS transporter, partial [Enterococcus casseliflavus]
MKEYQQNNGYRALVNAALLSGIGMSLFNIVFVVYASTLPFNALAVSLASMALLVPDLLRILTGYLADRTKNKVQWMISSRLLQGVLFVALAFLIQLPPSLWSFFLLLGINIVSDCLGAYCSGLQLPYVRRLVPADALDSAMGFQMACQTTVQIVFQGIGAWGIILLNNNFAAFGLINAVTFFLAAIVIFWNRSLFYAVPG